MEEIAQAAGVIPRGERERESLLELWTRYDTSGVAIGDGFRC